MTDSSAITICVPFDITALGWTEDGARIVAAGVDRLAMMDAVTGTVAWQTDLSDYCVPDHWTERC